MSLKVPDVGEATILDHLLGAYGDDLEVRLYQNDYTPVDGSVLGSFTQADFEGYAGQNAESWTGAVMASGRARSTADQITWTKGTGGTGNSIYGYYVVDADENLLWAERDPSAPVNMTSDGNIYRLTPAFTLKTEF